MALDAVQRLLIHHQLPAKKGGDRLLAQIVIGGAETAGGDDDVRPRKSKLQRLPQALRVISYHALVIDVDPQSRQLLGDVGGVGVDDVSHQNFCPDAEDLCAALSHGVHSLRTKIF